MSNEPRLDVNRWRLVLQFNTHNGIITRTVILHDLYLNRIRELPHMTNESLALILSYDCALTQAIYILGEHNRICSLPRRL
jgi:hypothetical protein